jgi:hypothetical protein
VGFARVRRKPITEDRSLEAVVKRAQAAAARQTEAPGEPEAYELLYNEAVRSLAAQEESIDELRTRAAATLSGAGVVSAFLGAPGLTIATGLSTTGPNPTAWSSLVAIFALIVLAAVLMAVSAGVFVSLLLAKSWTLRVSTMDLLANYIEPDPDHNDPDHKNKPAATLPEIHRSLAWYFAEAEASNKKYLDRMYGRFGLGAALFIADLLAWLGVLGLAVIVRLQA